MRHDVVIKHLEEPLRPSDWLMEPQMAGKMLSVEPTIDP